MYDDRCIQGHRHCHKKLGHQPEPQIKSLLHDFTAIFPNFPRMITAAVHINDVGDAASIKHHPYCVNPVKCAYMPKEVAYMLIKYYTSPGLFGSSIAGF